MVDKRRAQKSIIYIFQQAKTAAICDFERHMNLNNICSNKIRKNEKISIGFGAID